MDAHMCIGYRVDFVSVSIRLIKSYFVTGGNGQLLAIIHIMILKHALLPIYGVETAKNRMPEIGKQ